MRGSRDREIFKGCGGIECAWTLMRETTIHAAAAAAVTVAAAAATVAVAAAVAAAVAVAVAGCCLSAVRVNTFYPASPT